MCLIRGLNTARNASEVLQIVYAAPGSNGVSSGGLFPKRPQWEYQDYLEKDDEALETSVMGSFPGPSCLCATRS